MCAHVQWSQLVGLVVFIIIVTLGWSVDGRGVQSSATLVLYSCVENTGAEAEIAGALLCDAQPTPGLTERAERDNLLVRHGALVIEVDKTSISETAGLKAGDVIYRVGGVDVADAETAAKNLATVQTRSDTVVNFLRGGRPYRVKLRR